MESATQECRQPRKNETGTMDTWINIEGIDNILSIPRIEKSGYQVNHDTKEE